MGFSGRGACERHRWLVLRRRSRFSTQRYRLELRRVPLVPLRLQVPLRRMRGACRQSSSAVTAQTAALLSRQLGSRVAMPPFCHSAISPSYPLRLAICASLCIFLEVKISNKAILLFLSNLICFYLDCISFFFSSSCSPATIPSQSYTLHPPPTFSPLLSGPSSLSTNHGFGHRYGRWCRRRGFPGNS